MTDTPELRGKMVKGLRELTARELAAEGWANDSTSSPVTAIEFTDGTLIYASRDPEGNGPGALFGVTDGKQMVYRTTVEKGAGA